MKPRILLLAALAAVLTLPFGADGGALPTKLAAVQAEFAAAVPPKVTVSPEAYNFGEVGKPGTSPPQAFTIANAGASAVTITGVVVTGEEAADFAVEGPDVTVIAPGGQAKVTVTYSPKTPGLKKAAMEIALADMEPLVVDLAGTSGLPRSLKSVSVPEPDNLDEIVCDETAAIQLGKALFWDMQVGSDGIQACASCHYHAGIDPRHRNAVTPGLLDQRFNGVPGDENYQSGDVTFGNSTIDGVKGLPNFAPDYILTCQDFPLHLRVHPADQQESRIWRSTNDVISSQGVMLTQFVGIRNGNPVDEGTGMYDAVFHVGDKKMRRVEPRQTPSVINAVFNFANFWDGRANNIFNGVNPFGPLDMNAGVFVTGQTGDMGVEKIRLNNASLASQAVGPGGSDFEMSHRGRTLAHVGKKLLSLRPLQYQAVHPEDGVLGPLRGVCKTGLDTTYGDLIRKAFYPKYWNCTKKIIRYEPGTGHIGEAPTDSSQYISLDNGTYYVDDCPVGPLTEYEYAHMEANFALFFGLAVQMYEAKLVSDETPFDRYVGWQGPHLDGDPQALTDQQKRGLEIFMEEGRCINCHGGSEFTNASVSHTQNGKNLVEYMAMAQGNAFYDGGFYNVSVRKTPEDISRGGLSPFINPKTNEPFPLSFTRLAMLKRDGLLPEDVAEYVPDLPEPQSVNRAAVDGAQKTPGLRGVELTGPYFSNGGAGTLMQVVHFYTRGGNFPYDNIENLDPDISEIHALQGNVEDKEALVAFLLALTDDRVKHEKAPFDHPQLFIPVHGAAPDLWGAYAASYMFMALPAVGACGRDAEGLPPLGTFLGMDPMTPDAVVWAKLICDFNHDGVVNIKDFAIMAAYWKKAGSPPVLDVSGPGNTPDGKVDLYDVMALVSEWTE